MVSFAKAEIDHQPWERAAKVKTISISEVEANLMALMRDMCCYATVPAIFGRGLLEKYPKLIQDVLSLDEGIPFFLQQLPLFTPWLGVTAAHFARQHLWQVMDQQQIQLDKKANGEETDYSWGGLDDISELVMRRNKLWRGKFLFRSALNYSSDGSTT